MIWILSGLLLAISPVFLALAAGGGVFDEGNGGGAALWFLFYTVPLGSILMLVGVIRLIIKLVRK